MKNRSIYAAMKQGILLCDEQGRILYFNDSYSRFSGYKLKEFKGRHVTEICAESVVPQVIASGAACEGRLCSDYGRDFIADVNPVIEDGKVVGTVTVISLIEDIKLFRAKMNQLDRERQMLSTRLSRVNGTTVTFRDMVYVSNLMLGTIEAARGAAKHDAPILITGESGTGKNVFAQAIHNESSRREGPFVAINCGALAKMSLESELFGYEEAAYGSETVYGKAGLLEIAAGGTLFIDEISEMDLNLQRKLLYVLQSGKTRRMGSARDIALDVRIIVACNVDLEAYIEDQRFRRDLFEELSACNIYIPPLREHPEDIPVLTDYYLKMNRIRHKQALSIDPETREIFQVYPWPDNIRELKNTIAGAAAYAAEGRLTPSMLPRHMLDVIEEQTGRTKTLNERVREIEREEIRKMLRRFGDSTEGKRKAARALGISLATLYNKLGQ